MVDVARSALIIATHKYEDEKLRTLRAPAEDAQALARVLGDPDIGEFDVTLCDNPKEYELRRTVSTFFANRSPDDVLLVHFGCHGLKDDDGHLYFAAADTEFDHLDATAVPADFVNRRMNDSRSKRIVLFLDCCYSGAFAKGMSPRAGEQVEVKERFEGKGRVVLTASSAMEYSFEGEDRHGDGQQSVFTSALVHGLETGEADRDGDHRISVDELYEHVFERVREQTPNQRPGKWSFVEGDVFVARSAYVPPVEQQELPRAMRDNETNPLPSAREALVGDLQSLIATQPQFAVAARAALERLVDDDSRRVFTAAQAALDDLDTPASVPPPPTEEATTIKPEPAAADRPEPAPQRVETARSNAAETPPKLAAPRASAVGTPPRQAVRTAKPARTGEPLLSGAWPIVGAAAGLSLIPGAIDGWMRYNGLVDNSTVRALLTGVLGVLPIVIVLLLAGRSRVSWPIALPVAITLGAALNLVLAQIEPATTTALTGVWALSGAFSAGAGLLPSLSPRIILIGTLLAAVCSAVIYQVVKGMVIDSQPLWILVFFAIPYALGGAASVVGILPRVTPRA